MKIRKRLVLLCCALLSIPIGIIILLLRIMYYRFSDTQVTSTTNDQSILSVLADHYAAALIVLALLGAVAIIITGILFMRGFLRPIRQLARAAEEIERGNLDFDIFYDRKDEFLQVFTQFDRMRIKLKDSLWSQIRDEESKVELIANIAHDLRTPITSIQGYAQGLIDDVANTEEKRQKYLETIIVKSQELNRMSDSLSTFAHVGTRNVIVEKSRIHVKEFLEAEIEEMTMGTETSEISFTENIRENTYLNIDVMQVKRVFSNIVQNSRKYSGEKPMHLDIRVYENDKFVIFCFADQGTGVRESELKLIFNRFYRSDAARQDTRNGSGLGLSIAKQIVLLHSGYIWARQNTPRGLQIFISFPKLLKEHSHENTDH